MAKLLLVDDSPELLDFFSRLLRLKDYEVATATSKETALLQIKYFNPDLVILDVKLERENGRDVCREIRLSSAGFNIPVILLSASPELLKDPGECLADETIEKPFTMNTVIEKINRVLHKYPPR